MVGVVELAAVSIETSSVPVSNDQPNAPLREIIIDGSIYCRHNSDELSTSSQRSSARIQDTISECTPGTLTISGHTDSLGRHEYNRTLSTIRASLAMEELIS